MWYFAWILGIGFAVMLAILNALWMENTEARMAALRHPDKAFDGFDPVDRA